MLTGHTDIVTHVKLLVNDMVVDSVGGYLYWTTLYSVESTRLNGESSLILQAQPWLSGKKVRNSKIRSDSFIILSSAIV